MSKISVSESIMQKSTSLSILVTHWNTPYIL